MTTKMASAAPGGAVRADERTDPGRAPGGAYHAGSTQRDEAAQARSQEESLRERYAQLRASGLACDRW